MYTVALVLQFSNDGRYAGADWIERNVPANSTMGPIISEEKYNVINSLRRRDYGVREQAPRKLSPLPALSENQANHSKCGEMGGPKLWP